MKKGQNAEKRGIFLGKNGNCVLKAREKNRYSHTPATKQTLMKINTVFLMEIREVMSFCACGLKA